MLIVDATLEPNRKQVQGNNKNIIPSANCNLGSQKLGWVGGGVGGWRGVSKGERPRIDKHSPKAWFYFVLNYFHVSLQSS